MLRDESAARFRETSRASSAMYPTNLCTGQRRLRLEHSSEDARGELYSEATAGRPAARDEFELGLVNRHYALASYAGAGIDGMGSKSNPALPNAARARISFWRSVASFSASV